MKTYTSIRLDVPLTTRKFVIPTSTIEKTIEGLTTLNVLEKYSFNTMFIERVIGTASNIRIVDSRLTCDVELFDEADDSLDRISPNFSNISFSEDTRTITSAKLKAFLL